MAKQALDQWIGEIASDVDRGTLSMLSCVHQKGVSEVEVFSIKMGTAKKWTPVELANVFRSRAESYAEELAGVQTFYLLAFFDNRNEATARKPFRVNSSTDMDSVGGATEGPTGTGLTQQAMRHMEAVYQLSIKQQVNAFSAMESALRITTESNTKIARELGDAQALVFKLIGERMEAQFNRDMERMKYERTTSLMQKGLEYLPVAVNAISGKQVVPQETEDTAIVKMIGDCLDEERAKKLLTSGIFPPLVMGLIANRLEKHEKEKMAKQESIERISNGVKPEEELS